MELTLPDKGIQFGWRRKVPVVRQSERAECGLACLASLASFHGHDLDLPALRRRFAGTGQGLNLRQLLAIASTLGLEGRALRLSPDAAAGLQLPCLLHWDLNHFVVLDAIGRRGWRIVDPARGRRWVSPRSVGEHFTGVAVEFYPAQDFRPQRERHQLKLSDFWQRLQGLPVALAQLLFLALLLQLMVLAAPLYMQIVVDEVLLRLDHGLLLVLALGFALLLVGETLVRVLRQSLLLRLSARLNLHMSANLFRHLLRLPLGFFEQRNLGDIASRFGSLQSIRELLSTTAVSAVVDGLLALVTLVAMCLYDSKLALVVVVCVALYGGLRLALFPLQRRMGEDSLLASAEQETCFLESVRAMSCLKLCQGEQQRLVRWSQKLVDSLNRDIRIARLDIGLGAFNGLLFGLENIVVVFFAAKAVMAGSMTLGMLFAFMAFKQRFTAAMSGLVDAVMELRMLGLHLDRLADIALTEPESPVPFDAGVPPRSEALPLNAEGLGFAYQPDQWVFRGIELQVAAGESLAIVGPSGCGKTSLLKCLMGLQSPSEGLVLADGVALAQYPAFRTQIAAVMQSDQLLSGSLADNITAFDLQPDNGWMIACAEFAHIHQDILRLPMQYETPVGEMGASLSGGQIQRVLLARALYRRPRVLFLDEATSHLDLETETLIAEAIATLPITRIMVAHRPQTIALAGRVLALEPLAGRL